MPKTLVVVIFGVAFTVLLSLGIYRSWQNAIEKDDRRLMKQADVWIKKLNDYKKNHNKAPDSLQMIGIEVPDSCPLIYTLDRDSINYTISFQIGFFRSKAYDSQNRYWRITD
jgi:hypothetical protein